MALLYSVVNMISTVIGALGFGKPYSPVVILLVWITDLLGWLEKLTSLVVVVVL